MLKATKETLKPILYRGTLLLDRALGRLPAIGPFRPLKGSFSAWERLRSGAMEGGLLAESQEPGPFRPGSLDELVGMHQHHHQPWPVFWVLADDARLVGSMLHWRDSNDLLCIEGVFMYPKRRRLGEDAFLAQILLSKPVKLPGAWTSLASNWVDGRNYFHWITDGLTRLVLHDHLPEPTRILLPAKVPSYITETLGMLGIHQLATPPPARHVQPERFYFCSPSAMTGVWNPLGFEWLRERFAPYRGASASGPPVFLTRRGDSRVPEDLAAIESAFSSRGFKIVDCGSLSVKQQVATLSTATAIAGFHGAAMTNLLWAQPGTPVLEILSPDHLNACYEQIASQGRLPYTYHVMGRGYLMESIHRWLDELPYSSEFKAIR